MTSKQLLKAVKQLYFHKRRLGWIEAKIAENQAAILAEMITKGVDELVVGGLILGRWLARGFEDNIKAEIDSVVEAKIKIF